MRLLKENYDGLKKVNILSGSMKEFIKDFLSDPANQKLFKTKGQSYYNQKSYSY